MAFLIKDGIIVNRGKSLKGSIFILADKIDKIIYENEYPNKEEYNLSIKKIIDSKPNSSSEQIEIIEAAGLYILPGVIDDQVHFREPGAEYKATIESESKAAVLGGVTSFMDMPNNNPPTTTIEAVSNKNSIAKIKSYANYAFYLGATNDNINEILAAEREKICGVKVFMGSSTGNMLVDNPTALKNIFSLSPIPVVTHCEEEGIIQNNLKKFREKYGDNIPFEAHPLIRSREACIECSKKAIELACKYNTDLHILHISTADEIDMIKKAREVGNKITGEICVHYLWFNSKDYKKYGSYIKCNPAIKEPSDQEALINGLKNGIVSIVATDHAPHLKEEKDNKYLSAPSGLPLIRHSLQMMIELSHKGLFTLEEVVEYMCHAPSDRFKIKGRGYIEQGYFADITIVDINKQDTLSMVNPPYKCGWTPLQERIFSSSIIHTFVNGVQVVKNGTLTNNKKTMPLEFERKNNN